MEVHLARDLNDRTWYHSLPASILECLIRSIHIYMYIYGTRFVLVPWRRYCYLVPTVVGRDEKSKARSVRAERRAISNSTCPGSGIYSIESGTKMAGVSSSLTSTCRFVRIGFGLFFSYLAGFGRDFAVGAEAQAGRNLEFSSLPKMKLAGSPPKEVPG